MISDLAHNQCTVLNKQEIVLYCGRLIGTNPDMFRGILKIRVGWVLEAIRIYLELFPEEKKADATIESLSPYKLRTLLQKVLTVSDWADEKGYLDFFSHITSYAYPNFVRIIQSL